MMTKYAALCLVFLTACTPSAVLIPASPSPTSVPSATPTAVATAAASPTPAPIPSPTASATAVPTPTPSVSNDPVVVGIRNFAFSPSTVTVKRGTTVTFKNVDGTPHTATALRGEFTSGILENGMAFSFKFDKTGTVDYACSFHSSMTGKVIVTD